MFLQAKKDGRVRYVGFSAHNPDAAIALMDRFQADSVLFPVNFVTWSQGSFGPRILEAAKRKGVRRLALKAMAYTKWPGRSKESDRAWPKCWYRPVDEPDLASKAVRFTLGAGHHRRNPAR